MKLDSFKRSLTGKRSLVAALLLASIPLSIAGCKSTPTGRCGLPDLCDPTVVRDPFPYDVGVPCKGVDAENGGYYRPRWRVLNGPDAECCANGQCAPHSQVSAASQKAIIGQSQQVSLSRPALQQIELQQQNAPEATNRVNAIPVSMANPVTPPAPMTAVKTFPDQLFANPYSTEIDPIVLPAPLPPQPTTQSNTTQSALPLPSPISGVELAPVLTR